MTITLQDKEWFKLLWEGTQSKHPELLANPKNRTLILPSELGRGYKQDIILGRGVSLTLHRYQTSEDLIFVNSGMERDCVEFSFVMSAKVIFEGQLFVANQDVVFQNSDAPPHQLQQCGDTEFCAIDVHIAKSLFLSMVEDYEDSVLPVLRRIAAGKDNRPGLPPLGITPEMQQLLRQIWHCPHTGLTRSLFLEAKALELIGLYMQVAAGAGDNPLKLPNSDIESLHHAQDILQRNLATPPSLMELARQVGINDRKLKQGFREIFNTTVFGYLTQQRMERACELLQQEIAVATVASRVGYSSPAAFSVAFRRTLGTTPKGYQMSTCRGAR
ncbi:MAG: AraC family transcriptional regulator [Cyanobacteria bacterium P01_C01_bin.89]